ncbi:MAG: DoxX family protein [Crocinitomicaceae bacterium]|nr:DoxX family protein [Crocinitomicaceae bacterium]
MFSIEAPEIAKDIVLFFVRITIAIAFYREAQIKLKDVKKFATSHAMSVPMAGFVAVAELLAAISMTIGFLTQLAGLGIMLLMMGTTWLCIAKWKSPYWAQKGGWEYDVLMFVLSAVIVVFGEGLFSLSNLF